MQNQNAVRPLQAQNTAPPSIRWTAADQAIGYVMGAAHVVLFFVLLRRVYRYNRDVYSKALQRWQHSFMCQKCGQIVEMAVPQAALATNG
jgi:rubrerythrin